jgi:protein-tyrosine phosphatase
VGVTNTDMIGQAAGVIRRVPFAGALNFRDIGGYPAPNGGQTRWGVVYRSDALHHMTPADLPVFDALGVRAIYDLRRADELAQHPGPRAHIHLELPSGNPLADGESAKLRSRIDGERWLLEDYLGMLARAPALFGTLFSHLADPARLPAVFHCVGGKDRTGLTTALLLTALGVERAVVLEDYLLTNDYRGAAHVPDVVELFVESGMAREAAEGVVSAPRWVMEEALTVLDETYGGIESYLLGPGGLSPVRLAALRTVLATSESRRLPPITGCSAGAVARVRSGR